MRFSKLAAIVGMAAYAVFGLDNVIINSIKDKMVDNDVKVYYEDSVHVKGQNTIHIDDYAGTVDVFADKDGKLTDQSQDTSAICELLLRVNNTNTFSTNTHVIGIDGIEDAFNKNFVESADIPGDNIYKSGIEDSEVDSLLNLWFGLPTFTGIIPKPVTYRLNKPKLISGIYSIDGRFMGNSPQRLPSGIYIGILPDKRYRFNLRK